MALKEQELERLYECVHNGRDEQSVLTRRLLAEVLLERAACKAVGMKVVGEPADFKPVVFVPADVIALGEKLR
jgi:hypothetical protein